MEDQHFEDQLDLKKELFKYLSFWKLFLLFGIIAIVSVNIYLRYTNSVYAIEAKIKILKENDKGFKMPSDIQSLMSSRSGINMDNEQEVLKSKRLFGTVISDLNLTSSYFEEGNIKSMELWNTPFTVTSLVHKDSMFAPVQFKIQMKKDGYRIKTAKGDSHYIMGTHIKTKIGNVEVLIEPNANSPKSFTKKEILVVINPFKITLESTINRITAEKIGKESEILSVKTQEINVNKAIAIIDKLVEVFNEDGINDKRLINKKTVEFIDDRFRFLTEELDSIENEKKDFKQSKNMSFIEADAAVDVTRKATNDETLFKIETQIELSNLLKGAINSKKATLLPANIGLDNEVITQMVGEYNTLLLQRDKLTKTAGAENPVLKGLDSQIAEVKTNINESIVTYNKQLQISLNQQQFSFSKSKGLVSEIPSNEKILRAIERQQKIKENLYLILLQKREESAIAYAVTSPSIKIVDYASASLSPISPKKNILYLGALLIGLLIPFAGIYIFFLLDTKIKDTKETEFVRSEIPVIAEIPEFKDFRIFSDKNDRSVHAETFRILSSNVSFSLPIKEVNKGQVILVTSSIMGEGKTFIATNLALALASYNKKVLLIGADMRKPKLHVSLDMERDEKGLSSYLYNEDVRWKDVLVKENPYNDNLDILFSGFIPPNPSNIISNGRFDTLIREAQAEYDYVVIDSAPTIYVNDTFLIATLADLTVYVTRYNYTEKELVNYAKTLKDSAKLNNMVFVLNAIAENERGRYNYSYKYSYNYGYGYGYGDGGYGENTGKPKKVSFFKSPLRYVLQLIKK